MTPERFDPELHRLPPGTRAVTYTAPPSMPECMDLPTVVTPDGRVAMQWRRSAGELALLAAGAPVTVVLWSGGRVAPIAVHVGGADLS